MLYRDKLEQKTRGAYLPQREAYRHFAYLQKQVAGKSLFKNEGDAIEYYRSRSKSTTRLYQKETSNESSVPT